MMPYDLILSHCSGDYLHLKLYKAFCFPAICLNLGRRYDLETLNPAIKVMTDGFEMSMLAVIIRPLEKSKSHMIPAAACWRDLAAVFPKPACLLGDYGS